MILFAALAGLLLLIALAFVLWPLWRGAPAATGSRRGTNIAVFEQQTADIEQETQTGWITQAQADTRQRELGARLVEDVGSASGRPARDERNSPWLVSTIVVAAFAALAIGMYAILGDLRGLHLQERPDIAQIVSKMKMHLAEVPGDLQTRALLAQVQLTQDKYQAAAHNLKLVNTQLDKPDPAFLLAEARARVLADNGAVGKRAQALYEHVLELSPDNTEALWFAGLAAVADGQNKLPSTIGDICWNSRFPRNFAVGCSGGWPSCSEKSRTWPSATGNYCYDLTFATPASI